jgi:hypothetical protein
MVKGGENGFALKGGDATQGSLKTMYNGARPNGYQPMKKCVPRNGTRPGRTRGQLTLICDPPRPPRFARPIHYPRRQGSIILGIGGDNSDSAVGTFYEGCGASASSFPPFSLPPLAHSLTRILSARPTTPLFPQSRSHAGPQHGRGRRRRPGQHRGGWLRQVSEGIRGRCARGIAGLLCIEVERRARACARAPCGRYPSPPLPSAPPTPRRARAR